MGAADIVPGVSGGTMAFILGIYERLLNALKSLNGDALYNFITFKWRALGQSVDFKTLIAVGLGIGGAIFFFTHIISLPELLKLYKARVYGFFFGLVFGTIILLLWRYQSSKLWNLMMLLLGAMAGIALLFLKPTVLPNTPIWMFGSGMVAVTAMLLPGISGSYILLLLGKYEPILNAVQQHKWAFLSVFMLGMIAGGLLFVRAISWLMQKYHDSVIFFITGLIAGTLPMLWPLQYWKGGGDAQELGIIGGLMLGGVGIIWGLNAVHQRIGR